MANSGGVRAGKAFVEIGANDSALRKALASAQARLESFGRVALKTGAAVAGLGAAGIGAAVVSFVAAGSAINDIAARTGASVEGLSELGFAAKLSGTTMESVEGAFRKAAKVITEAGQGSKQAADALANLGLTAQELQGLKPDQQFEKIAKALNGIQDPTTKAAYAMAVFGKSGTQLLPMITDLDALTARAKELGIVMSAQDVAAADALGDAFDTVRAAVGGLANSVGVVLAPALTFLAEGFADIIGRVTGFARTYQELFTNVVIDSFAAVLTAAVNWRTTLSVAVVAVELAFVKLGNEIVHRLEYAVTVAEFFATNWRAVLTDVNNYLGTVLDNMVVNLTNFFLAVESFFSEGKFDFEWTALSTGFQRTLASLPEIAAREMGPLEAALTKELDDLTAKLSTSFDKTKTKILDATISPVKDSFISERPQLAAAAVATTAVVARRVGNAGADRFGSAGALSSQGQSQRDQRDRKALQVAEESKRILKDLYREVRDKKEPVTVKI